MIRRFRWVFAFVLMALSAGAFAPQAAVAQSGGPAVVFTSTRYRPAAADGTRAVNLYVLQDGKVRRITDVDNKTVLTYPAWSPDGKEIAAIRTVVTSAGFANATSPEVVIVNVATGKIKAVPGSAPSPGSAGQNIALGTDSESLDWGPGGSGLLFLTRSTEVPTQTLHVNGKAIPVPEDMEYRNPSFTPDGDRILVVRSSKETYVADVGTLNLSGGDFTSLLPPGDPTLEPGASNWYLPKMSPDASRCPRRQLRRDLPDPHVGRPLGQGDGTLRDEQSVGAGQ